MKIVSVSIAVKDCDVKYVERALSESQLGVYHFGTEVRDATKEEAAEVVAQVPVEILVD